MNNFVSLMIKLMQIQKPELYISELARGTKPGKAARKAMATCTPEVLEIFGSATLAVTVDEINEAYSTSVKSCMQGYPVGEYYSLNKIGVIWTNNFRILVRLSDLSPVSNAYGFHSSKAEQYLGAAGLRRVFSEQLCEDYPLAGPEVVFNPYLDWHADYYNNLPCEYYGDHDEDDDYHGEYYRHKFEAQDQADARVEYEDLIGILNSGSTEGDFDMQVYLMDRLDAVFPRTNYSARHFDHREFRTTVQRAQAERRAVTAHQFTDMRSLLIHHGYLPANPTSPVVAGTEVEDDEDMPF